MNRWLGEVKRMDKVRNDEVRGKLEVQRMGEQCPKRRRTLSKESIGNGGTRREEAMKTQEKAE